jgi:hypothetical protein
MTSSEVERATTFRHDTKWKAPHGCDGIFCIVPGRDRSILMNNIQCLRLQIAGAATKAQGILDRLWSIAPEMKLKMNGNDQQRGAAGLERLHALSIFKLPFRLGERKLCHHCFAAAAGCMTDTAGGASRHTTSWGRAVTAFKSGATVMPTNSTKPKAQDDSTVGLARDWRAIECMAWLRVHVNPDLGFAERRVQDDGVVYHLQYTSRDALHNKYENDEAVDQPLSYSRFCTILTLMNKEEADFYIKCGRKHKAQQKCQICVDLGAQVYKAKLARNTQDIVKYEAALEQHNRDEREERVAYATRRMAGRRIPRTLSVGMDAIDSFKSRVFSWNGNQVKNSKAGSNISKSDSFSYKTTGAIVHGWGYMLFVGNAWVRGDGNFNVHCMHLTLLRYFVDVKAGKVPHPNTFHMQVDGGSDNRCGWFFSYMEYLVKSGIFEVVTVGFEIVGHTHDDYDRMLSHLWKALKRWKVNTIGDYCKCIEAAYPGGFLKEITVVDAVPDYKAPTPFAVG